MLAFYYDRSSKFPLYIQLYQFIRSEIECGNLIYQQKMPSKRKLSAHLKISQITVDSAYQQLVAEGYLKSIPKSGYYVELIEQHSFPKKEIINTPKVERMQKNYLYDFKINVVDKHLFPNQTWARLAREIFSENTDEILNVSEPQGLEFLRAEIAKYLYHFRGINALPEQIVIGAGIESLLSILIKLLGRSNIYAIENPGYNKITHIFETNDVQIVTVSLDDQGLRVDELIKTKANIVHTTPSHQFPTGIIMPIRRRQELLAWANESEERYILEDDYVSEFRFTGQPIPALQGIDTANKVIYFNSFSKSIAPSLRISYMVLPINILEKYKKVYYHSSNVPNFEQYILYKFMKGGYFERHINRMRNAYKLRQETLINAINSSKLVKIVSIYGYDAGLHLLLEVNGYSEAELIKRASDYGVKVYGLSNYYQSLTNGVPNNCILIGYSSLSVDDIKKSVILLEKAWCE